MHFHLKNGHTLDFPESRVEPLLLSPTLLKCSLDANDNDDAVVSLLGADTKCNEMQ